MSYKPTRSRKYKVSPVGTAQSVGFQVSRELDSIASNLSNIGTNFRKAQFEEAKRKFFMNVHDTCPPVHCRLLPI